MPRTAGGAINPQRAAEAYFAAKERDQGCMFQLNYSDYIFSPVSRSKLGGYRW